MRGRHLTQAFSICLLTVLCLTLSICEPLVSPAYSEVLVEEELFDDSLSDMTDDSSNILSEETVESDADFMDAEPESSGNSAAANESSGKAASKGTVFDADGLIEDTSGNKIDENIEFEITDENIREEIAREEAEIQFGPVYGRLYPPAPLLEGINSFRQGDMRWGTHPYGYANAEGTVTATISSSGCGLLSLVNAVYYMTGNFIDPVMLADWSWNHGFRMNGTGTVHSLYQAFSAAYGSVYGFSYAGTASSLSEIRKFLAEGGTAIISTYHHLICVADYNIKKGGYLLLDSAPSPYRGTYPTGYCYLPESDFSESIPIFAILLLEPLPGERDEVPYNAMMNPRQDDLAKTISASGDAVSFYNYILTCYLREMPALVYQKGLGFPVSFSQAQSGDLLPSD